MRVEQPVSLAVPPPAVGALVSGPQGALLRSVSKYSWTNALVAGLSGTTGNLTVATLPAKTVVNKATLVITGQAAGVTALTVSVGRTATAYVDYLVAKSAKAAANTVYGQVIGDVGTSLSAILGDLPSVAGATAVVLQFVSAVENLSAVTGSSGDVYLETTTYP